MASTGAVFSEDRQILIAADIEGMVHLFSLTECMVGPTSPLDKAHREDEQRVRSLSSRLISGDRTAQTIFHPLRG